MSEDHAYLGTAIVPAASQGFDYYGLSVEPGGKVSSTTEPDMWRGCQAAFRPSDRVLVGGGGVGSLSVLLALWLGNENVWTVEPNPAMLGYMRQNIAVKKMSLQLSAGALGVGTGTTQLALDAFYGNARSGRGEGDLTVPLIDINDFVRRHRLSALALDVEGAEGEVLAALDTGPIRALVVETHPPVDVIPMIKKLVALYPEVRCLPCHGEYGFLLTAQRAV